VNICVILHFCDNTYQPDENEERLTDNGRSEFSVISSAKHMSVLLSIFTFGNGLSCGVFQRE
jgi:hypothetical protein